MAEITIRKAGPKDIDRIVELSGMMADYHHKIEPSYWNRGIKTMKLEL